MNPNKLKVVSLNFAQVVDVYKGNKRLNEKAGTNDKRLYCKVLMNTGVYYENVPFYGGTVDVGTDQEVGTGNMHGVFMNPVKGQMVGITFIEGNFENPYCCYSIPHPWLFKKNGEKFSKKIDEELVDIEDGGIFHKSGSKAKFLKDGSVEIKNHDESGTIIMKADGTIEVNGNADNAVRFSKLKEAFDTLKAEFDAHIHITTATVGASATPGTISPTTPSSAANIDPAKVDEVKLP